MNTTIDQLHHEASTAANTIASSPAHQAYWILKFGFTVAPILAGLDKFFHLLANWDQYLPGVVANISPIPPHTLMLVVGVIEIVAGNRGGAEARKLDRDVGGRPGGGIINQLLFFRCISSAPREIEVS